MTTLYTVYDLLDALKRCDIDFKPHEKDFDEEFYLYSVKNAQPIGTIVLYTEYVDDKSFIRHYGIVDGQKRVRALKKNNDKKLLSCHINVEFVYSKEKAEQYRKILNGLA